MNTPTPGETAAGDDRAMKSGIELFRQSVSQIAVVCVAAGIIQTMLSEVELLHALAIIGGGIVLLLLACFWRR